MSKLLLHPPDTTQSFTLNGGCGRPHEYDGTHGIDCPPCVELVRLMSPEERIQHPHLRGPIAVAADTPGELDVLRRAEEDRRHAASYRLEEAEDESPPPPPATADLVEENERLKAELTAEREAQLAVLESSPAFRLGRAMAEAYLPPASPYDGRSNDGKQYKLGYDSVKGSA